MNLSRTAASVLFAAFGASTAYAGSPLINVHVSAGTFQAQTDGAGNFDMRGVKAGTYDVVVTGNPLKSFLNEPDGGQRVSLTVDGKRFPLTCTIAGCKAAAVPIRVDTKGSVVNLSN